MRLNRPSAVMLAALAGAASCKRNNPPPPPAVAPPNTVPTVGPAGTTPTTPQSPTGQQVQITAQNAGGPSSTVSVPPTPATGCPASVPFAQLGPGTVHSHEVGQNETWTLEGSPHRLPHGTRILANATVTLAPCAVVLLGHGQDFTVTDGGAVMAMGEAQRPVRFGSDSATPQPGDWNSVFFEAHARATSRLTHVLVEHGGGGAHGCISSRIIAPGLDAQNVTARDCRGHGFMMEDGAVFAASSANLTVTRAVAGGADATGAVLFDDADAVRTLPTGTYTGNAVDEITLRVGSQYTVRTTATWRNPGVRYHVIDGIELRVEGPTAPVLTLAPGTTLAFGRDAGLSVGWDTEGGLVADGQAENTRIVFTTAGSDQTPGAWKGLYLGTRMNRSRTRLNFVTIQYGGSGDHIACHGANQAGDGALLFIDALPGGTAITHTRFVGAPADGAAIARNWNGPGVNFADAPLGNDFTAAIAACHQTPAHNADTTCPDPVPPCQ